MSSDRPLSAAERSAAPAAPGFAPNVLGQVLAQPLVRLALLALLVAAGIALVSAQFLHSLDDYMADDAFISFRYARNLADGLGPVWQRSDRVEGYTNFGWVLILAIGQKLGVAPRTTARTLGVVFSAATLAMIPVLVAQLRDAWTPRWWVVSIAAVLATALNTGFVIWTFAGLEVTAVAFFVTAAVTAFLYEERGARMHIASPLLLVAAALLRPDSVVVFAALALIAGLRLLARDWRAQLPHVLVFGAIFVVLFGTFWAWRWSYYGHFYPNTYYLKVDRSATFLHRGWAYVWDFTRLYGAWLVVLALVPIAGELRARYRPMLTLLAVDVLWCAYVATSGGDWMPYFRFFAGVLPITYVLIFEGGTSAAEAVLPRLRTVRYAAILPPAVAVALLCATFAFTAIARDNVDAIEPQKFGEGSEHLLRGSLDEPAQREIGEWLHDNLPPNYTVAEIATGIVPYYSQLPTIDMLGVNDEHIAHLDIPLGSYPSGHEKSDAGYVLLRKPEIIWLGLDVAPNPQTRAADYGNPPCVVGDHGVYSSTLCNPYLWVFYRPVAVRLQRGWFNILVRADIRLPLPPGSIDSALGGRSGGPAPVPG